MYPELEDFLEAAFKSIERTSSNVGRVVVEPDYDRTPEVSDSAALGQELKALLEAQPPAGAALTSYDGFEVKIQSDQILLKKYLRKITLHANALAGSWVEVAPPGNWI